MRVRRGAAALLLALAVGSVLTWARPASAQEASPEPMTTLAITITGHEFSFDVPADVPAGLVTVQFDNAGEFRHHVQLFKLNDGVTAEQFTAGLEDGSAFGMGVAAGGPGTVSGGQSASSILRLSAGQYAALCFVTGGDGIPHFAKGMQAFFTVSGEDAGEPDPVADAEVTLGEYSITLPQTSFSAGQVVWKVTNVGVENHELAVLKLPEGMTVEAYVENVTNPPTPAPTVTPGGTPPAAAPRPQAVGGMKALGTNVTGWAILDLEPGEYVAVCFIPDPNGTPHIMLGMVAGFTVT